MIQDLLELINSPQAWVALIALTFMEVILGIDNVIFISIVANKLPADKQEPARRVGLLIAMVMRIILLLGLGFILQNLNTTWFTFHFLGFYGEPNAQAFVLVAGGFFLLYKTIKEINHKLEGHDENHLAEKKSGKVFKFSEVVIQIAIINLVFSLDSILTAIGLTQDLTSTGFNTLPVMILGVVLSIIIMMWFAGPIGNYINKHPAIQMLALSFLLLISFMLLAEGSHAADAKIGYGTEFEFDVHAIPKGYLYFAIAFSSIVQMLIIRMQKKTEPVQLHGHIKEAEEENII